MSFFCSLAQVKPQTMPREMAITVSLGVSCSIDGDGWKELVEMFASITYD